MYACAQVERDLATARADIVQIDEARMKAVEKANAAARALQVCAREGPLLLSPRATPLPVPLSSVTRTRSIGSL
eukprot:2718692-Pleurochrysis_carterae.AAC.1